MESYPIWEKKNEQIIITIKNIKERKKKTKLIRKGWIGCYKGINELKISQLAFVCSANCMPYLLGSLYKQEKWFKQLFFT